MKVKKDKKIERVILVGGFHEVIELCELNKIEIVGIIDSIKKNDCLGYPIIGTDKDAIKIFASFKKLPLIVTPDQPLVRKRVADFYSEIGFNFINLVSPSSLISKTAILGIGVIVNNLVNISANVKINDFVRINVMANVMHDCVIDSYTTIAPNAVVLGNVKIGSLSYIGSNSTILPGVTIGKNVIIGAGTVVTKDCLEPGTYVGVPARRIN